MIIVIGESLSQSLEADLPGDTEPEAIIDESSILRVVSCSQSFHLPSDPANTALCKYQPNP